MIETFIFIAQIIALLACIFMLWKSRRALNGMGRATMLLCVALIIRRFDDAWHILSDIEVLILSSAVVALVFYDVLQIYKEREAYLFYLANRQERIATLEAERKKHSGDNWNQAYKRIT